jgi:hypothetical protein
VSRKRKRSWFISLEGPLAYALFMIPWGIYDRGLATKLLGLHLHRNPGTGVTGFVFFLRGRRQIGLNWDLDCGVLSPA